MSEQANELRVLLKKNHALSDSICQTGDPQIAEVTGRECCTSFPSVTFHYLEGCEQPAWPHPKLCTEAVHGRGPSWFAERRDTCKGEGNKYYRKKVWGSQPLKNPDNPLLNFTRWWFWGRKMRRGGPWRQKLLLILFFWKPPSQFHTTNLLWV